MGKLRTVFRIFCYANKKETTILILSLLAAIGNSFISPFAIWALFTPTLKLFMKMETPGNPFNVTRRELISRVSEIGYGYFTLSAIDFILGIIQIMASETVSRNIIAKIKTDYLAKMLSIDISWYDKSQEQFISTVSQ
ncbi:unnamed protein product, partial [Nezara viridula]